MTTELLMKLKKNSKLERVNVLTESDFFNKKTVVPTPIPILNIAMGGSLKGGIEPGLTIWAGESKNFKTSYMLVCLKSFLDANPDGIGIWFDSEFGSPPDYFKAFNIDTNRVLHVPIMNIEELKFEAVNQLEQINRGDKVMFCVDSLGNLASKKEIEDAVNEKSVADLTRAKAGKSLFRIITPYLRKKEIPMHVIAHTYDTMEMYSKKIVSGGKGQYFSADNIYIIGRQQEKGADGIEGWHFVINIEKSRTVKEKKKFTVSVLYDKGIDRYSGLLDLGLASGFVVKPKMGWYARVNQDTGEIEEKSWREKQTHTKDFWSGILENPKFEAWINEEFRISANSMIASDDSIDEAAEDLMEDTDD